MARAPVKLALTAGVALVLGLVALSIGPGANSQRHADANRAIRGLATQPPTPTLPVMNVALSKEDADTSQRLADWEIVVFRGLVCQGHPINDARTGTEPVRLQLPAGEYSFLETMQPGWVNVTPLCQGIDLHSADGALVFRNRRGATPEGLPDLTVDSISDAQQPFDCRTPAGVKVVVRNAGAATAGPSTTRVSVAGGTAQLLPTGPLAPREAVALYSSVVGIPLGDTYTAEADYDHDIIEADETNNTLSQSVALSTLPTCTPTPTATPSPPRGDANCDGAVNSIDALLVLQLSAGLLGSIGCEQQADVNGDGRVNSIDTALILQFTAGLINLAAP